MKDERWENENLTLISESLINDLEGFSKARKIEYLAEQMEKIIKEAIKSVS